MYEANPRTKAWRATMQHAFTAWTANHGGAWEPLDGPLEVEATFYFERPRRPKFDAPAVKPDLDKLCRALGDALTAAEIVTDDARIVTWHAHKTYGSPGVSIHYVRSAESWRS